ncbi:unnamed protein product, partial [Mesorhabditis spiculigera]
MEEEPPKEPEEPTTRSSSPLSIATQSSIQESLASLHRSQVTTPRQNRIGSLSALIDPKMAPADRSRFPKINLRTNIYRVELDPDTIVYRYTMRPELVLKSDQGRPAVDLSRRGGDDAERTRRAELIRLALKTALETYGLLRNGTHVVHDDSATIFTDGELQLKQHNDTLTVNIRELPQRARELVERHDAEQLRLEIVPCREFAASFRLGDALEEIKLGGTDRPLRQFLEILTSQPATGYTNFGKGRSYKDVVFRDLGQFGHERRHGVRKGIRFLEGPTGGKDLLAALVLDTCTGTFYKPQPLLKAIMELNGWRTPKDVHFSGNGGAFAKTNWFLHGLRLGVDGTPTTFVSAGLTKDAIGNQWPLVLPKGKKGQAGQQPVPIEKLSILPNQRVPLNKAEVPPDKPVFPAQRYQGIANHLAALDLATDSRRTLASLGVKISPKPLEVEGFVRNAPAVNYGEKRLPTENASWKTMAASYAVGANLVGITVLWNGPKFVQNAVHQFATQLQQKARAKGINIGQVDFIADPVDIEAQFREKDSYFVKAKVFETKVNAARRQNEPHKHWMIIYADAKAVKSHGFLKLAEAKHQILTMHITTETLQKLSNFTWENVLAKLNMKAGGLNHSVVPQGAALKLWNSNTLVIGYDVAHPTKGLTARQMALGNIGEPSVVGFSANCTEHRDAFIGHFAYQQPRREAVSDQVLDRFLKWTLKCWRERRGRQLPENIIVMRDGVSEGQYDMVLQNELEALRAACQEFQPNYHPKFCLNICTKRHHKRFLKTDGNGVTNAPPLTVVDRDVVSASVTEFYIQSHVPLQGTAKPTQYEMLKNEIPGMTEDVLQDLIIALTFQHQICPKSVSIPEPVYQADELAKRGSELFNAYLDANGFIPRKEKDIDWDDLTKRLSNEGKNLDGLRANA